ncbi:MAG: hypothetical protein WAN48_15925, partial [Actinomycetes bacterium]
MSRAARAAALPLALVALAACSTTSTPSAADGSVSASASQPSTPGDGAPPAGQALVVRTARWTLPTPLSRPVVFATQDSLVIAGGLDSNDASLAQVRTVDPASGHALSSGSLAVPVHDAAGGQPGSRMLVFGGGDTVSTNVVQQLNAHGRSSTVGSLPSARSDLSAATVDGATYVLGGYDGTSMDRTVLKTTDGVTYSAVATLPVGVRYAAVVGTADSLWVFGGERSGIPVDLVQRVDLATGRARVAGHLPRPLSHASAVDLSGQVFVAGGRTTGTGLMATVLAFDPTKVSFRVAGQLPMGISDMGAAVEGDTAYLVGGEAPGTTRSVVTLSLSSSPTAVDSSESTQSPDAAYLAPPTGPTYLAAGSNPSALPSPILIADKLNNRLIIVDPQGRVRWTFPRPGDLAPGQTFLIPDDAFFSPDGTQIVATEEDNYVVSVIDIARHRITYRYGTPGVPGSGPNHLNNPDDAIMLRNGDLLSPDIKNCRILRVHSGSHRPSAIYGTTGSCSHQPSSHFG